MAFHRTIVSSIPVKSFECLFSKEHIFRSDCQHKPSDEINSLENYYKTFGEYIETAKTVVRDNVKHIYACVMSPFDEEIDILYTCPNGTKVTYGLLLCLHTFANQYVYKLTEIAAPAKRRRVQNSINNLQYNGISCIEVYDDAVVCDFDCDY